MTASHDLERRLAEHLAREGTARAPAWVLGNALATIETTPQRRALLRAPWRFERMTNMMRLAGAGVAVVAVAGIGLVLIGGTGGTGPAAPAPTPSPTVAPSPTPAATPAATPTPAPTAPPLSETFTSTRYGISIAYPAGWTAEAATEQATSPDLTIGDGFHDVMFDPGLPTGRLFLSLASLPLGEMTAEAWIAETAGVLECASTAPVTVDGERGAMCDSGQIALVPTGGRGYVIRLYTSDDPAWVGTVFTPAWFESVLETVRLSPEATVLVSPSPS